MSRLEDRRQARDKKSRDGLKVLHARAPLVAAVDLGASKVSCFIMKPEGVRRADRTINVAGVGYVQSKGVRGGSIINMEEAAQAIAQAVERAEAMAGVSVSGVSVATAGGQLSSCRVTAAVALARVPSATTT
jgi:cell division protein FtsA